MRTRLRRAHHRGGASLTPLERHADSRAALYWSVERATEAGKPLVAIAREPGMPSRATLERWLDSDPRMRARHVAALERQRMVDAEELVVEADRRAEYARGRRRVIALRSRIAARTALLRLLAAAEKKANAAANDDAPARGISEEGIAILEEAAAKRFTAPVSSNDDSPGDDTRDEERDDPAASESPCESEDDEESSSWSAEDSAVNTAEDTPFSDSSSCFSSCHPREGGNPRIFVEQEEARGPTSVDGRARARPKAAFADHDDQEGKNVDPRLRGDDEMKKDDEHKEDEKEKDAPPVDSPSYAPEDKRYRATSPDEESDEPQFHRLPLSVAEQEALKAHLAGRKPPRDEKKSPWKPDTPTYVRFDVGGGFDVSNRREPPSGMADYDPLDW